MKHLQKYMAASLLLIVAVTGCSPESFDGAEQRGVPTMEGVDFKLNVDQETNQMTATMDERQGFYPIWIINGATYSTLPTVSWANKTAGTYEIELHLANRNGISQASVKKQFTFEKTLVDWSPYYNCLNGKTWRVMAEENGHLGCGPSGTSGTEWWSAMPHEKDDFGMYDDRLTFNFAQKGDAKGTYNYDPGVGGTMYVNTGATNVYPEYNPNDGKDFMAKVQKQQVTFSLESGTWIDNAKKVQEGIFIVLPPKTLFPYIANNEQWNNPRLRIEHIDAKRIDLVTDNGGIAWHITLSSEEEKTPEEKGFGGYAFNSECNMWKNMTYTSEFYYAPGWVVSADPITFKDKGNGAYDMFMPNATDNQWQAQVKFLTDMSTNAVTNYDFSANITASEEIKGATLKLVKTGDDGVFFFEQRINLNAGEPTVFYKDNLPGIDMEKVSLVLDFGGSPAGTEVKLKDVVLKEHDCDDGTGHPETK